MSYEEEDAHMTGKELITRNSQQEEDTCHTSYGEEDTCDRGGKELITRSS